MHGSLWPFNIRRWVWDTKRVQEASFPPVRAFQAIFNYVFSFSLFFFFACAIFFHTYRRLCILLPITFFFFFFFLEIFSFETLLGSFAGNFSWQLKDKGKLLNRIQGNSPVTKYLFDFVENNEIKDRLFTKLSQNSYFSKG